MKLSIGSDHGGFELKEQLRAYLTEEGYEVKDCGCYSTASCDYPEFGRAVAYDVRDGKADFGIVICTTGIGISIAANKVSGIRAGLCHNLRTAELTRLHNNANILAMGAGEVALDEAKAIARTFLETPFSAEERHIRRVNAIEEV